MRGFKAPWPHFGEEDKIRGHTYIQTNRVMKSNLELLIAAKNLCREKALMFSFSLIVDLN